MASSRSRKPLRARPSCLSMLECLRSAHLPIVQWRSYRDRREPAWLESRSCSSAASLARRPDLERCELCGAALAAEHQHLLEPAARRLCCSCDACAILFSDRQGTRYLRVPREVRLLSDFRLTDAHWEGLAPADQPGLLRRTAARPSESSPSIRVLRGRPNRS